MNIKLKFGLFSILLTTQLAQADSQWFSYTLDNDIFVGNDSGYSNGMYFSWVNVDEDELVFRFSCGPQILILG